MEEQKKARARLIAGSGLSNKPTPVAQSPATNSSNGLARAPKVAPTTPQIPKITFKAPTKITAQALAPRPANQASASTTTPTQALAPRVKVAPKSNTTNITPKQKALAPKLAKSAKAVTPQPQEDLSFLDNISLRKDRSEPKEKKPPTTLKLALNTTKPGQRPVQQKTAPTTRDPATAAPRTKLVLKTPTNLTNPTIPNSEQKFKATPVASTTEVKATNGTTRAVVTPAKPLARPPVQPSKPKATNPEDEFLEEILSSGGSNASRKRKLYSSPSSDVLPATALPPRKSVSSTNTTTTLTRTNRPNSELQASPKLANGSSIKKTLPVTKKPIPAGKAPTSGAPKKLGGAAQGVSTTGRPLMKPIGTPRPASRPVSPAAMGYDLSDGFIDDSDSSEIDRQAFGGFLKSLGLFRGVPSDLQAYRDLGGESDDWADDDLYEDDCEVSGFEQLRREEDRSLRLAQIEDKIERMREKKGDAAAEALRKQLLPKMKAARGTPKAAPKATPKTTAKQNSGTKKPAARGKAGVGVRAGRPGSAPSGLPPSTVTRTKVTPAAKQKQISSIDDLF